MEAKIAAIKEKIIPTLQGAGVARSAIFGSLARGEQTTASDVDILVELPRGKSLLDLADLKLRLEEVLQKKVDLLTYRSISPLLRDIIRRDQIEIL